MKKKDCWIFLPIVLYVLNFGGLFYLAYQHDLKDEKCEANHE